MNFFALSQKIETSLFSPLISDAHSTHQIQHAFYKYDSLIFHIVGELAEGIAQIDGHKELFRCNWNSMRLGKLLANNSWSQLFEPYNPSMHEEKSAITIKSRVLEFMRFRNRNVLPFSIVTATFCIHAGVNFLVNDRVWFMTWMDWIRWRKTLFFPNKFHLVVPVISTALFE